MPDERPSYLFVIAPNRPWFERWCRQDNDPPLDPNAKTIVSFTNEKSITGSRGFRIDERDRLVVLGDPIHAWPRPAPFKDEGSGRMVYPTHPFVILIEVMIALGFTSYDDGKGRSFKL